MSTVPASGGESAVRIKAAPALVLAAVEQQVLDMATAVEFARQRSAEAARLAAMGGAL